MTIPDFLLLNEKEKESALETGVLIGKRKTARYRIYLYQLPRFYAEIYFLHHGRTIEKIKPFTSTEQLWPYLNRIDISAVIEC